MKKWVSTIMLFSLFGSFISPIIGSATETVGSSSNSSVNEQTTINSVSKDPQKSITPDSKPIPEKIPEEESTEIENQLSFDKMSQFVEQATKEQMELELIGKVDSSVENDQPLSFEMTKGFALAETKDEEKIILDEQKQPIGKYTVDQSADRTKVTLNFNKLAKGENRFRLILLGTLANGPDQKTVNFYQEEKEIFQLPLPEIKESSDTTVKEEKTSTTETTTDFSKESTKSSTAASKESSSSSKETTKESSRKEKLLKAQDIPREAGSIEDLYTQFALGDNFVKGINLNYDPNPPTINSVVDFKLDFSIPESVRTEMVPGDYYEMDFPQGLAIQSPSPHGNLTDEDGTIYGTYIFDASTQKLRITFTKQDGEDFLPPESGSVSADVHFDTKKITQPGETTIVYPTKTNIPPLTITIKPTGGSSISKSGYTDTPNNPSKVIWNVDFNKDFSELDKPLLTEHFPEQVTFTKADVGAVTIYPLNLDFDGNVTGTAQTPLDPSTYTVADDGSIQFNTAIDRPYRIVYSTTIKDAAKPTNGGTVPVTNKATLTTGSSNLDASATVQLNYKKALEKSQTGYDRVGQIYSWQIRYNYGQKTLADDTVISDTYTNMEVEQDSFNVYTVNFDSNGNVVKGAPLDPADYSIDTSTNPFTVTFKNNVQAGKAINIDYKTKVNKIVSGSADNPVSVSNQAETNTIPSTPTNKYTPNQQVVIKNKPTIDVGTKTAHYVIDINKNKYEMENALFTDTMNHSKDGYVSVPFKVKSPVSTNDGGVIIHDVSDGNRLLTGAMQLVGADNEVIQTVGDAASADYLVTVNITPDGQGYTNFTVKFQNSYVKTSHQFKMEYYVAYNQFNEDVPNPNSSIDYQNTMNANFVNNGRPYDSSSTTDFKTSTQEANQGMKSGSYNPATKEITWTIIANYNDLQISAFDLKDPITGNQVYDPSSLVITRGKIDSTGIFIASKDPDYVGNQVGKDYLSITNPQQTGEEAQGTLSAAFGTGNNFIPGWNITGSPMVFQIQFKTSLQGKIVYDQSTYENTAITTVEGVEQRLTASVSVAFGGQSALKTGNYNTQTGLINWRLDINPNQSLLSNVKIQDTPSSNQILQESFKLYTGKYSGSGNSTTVQPDQLVPSDQYKVQVTTDPATGQQNFSVDMSDIKEKSDPNNEGDYLTGVIEKPYVLVYDSEPVFTSKTETVSNNASITSEGKELPGKYTQKNITVTIQDSSGTAYGTKGRIVVQKVDGKGSIVAGAVLQLVRKNVKNSKTDILYQTTTDSDGKATFGNLIATSATYEYYVKEIEAPDGYTISPELVKGIKIPVNTDNNTTTITQIKNEVVKVLFKKTDSTGNVLSGGLFNLYRNSGTTAEPNYILERMFVATKEGVDLSGLGDGQYRISETISPDGYQINQTPIDFEIKKNDDNTRNVFVDDKPVTDGVLELKDYQGSALLQKTDENGKELAGAQFSVQRAELNSNDYSDFGDQRQYVTNDQGQLRLNELSPGKYKVKESKAPDGYYLNSREMTFSIDPISPGDKAPETINMNEGEALIDYQGSARFKKVDGHDYTVNQEETPLSGAKFQLYDESGKTAIGDEVTSGKEGYFTFKDLKPGTTYGIKETEAPAGYLDNQQLIRFTTPVTNNQGDSAVAIDSPEQKLILDEKTPFKNYKESVHFQKIDEENRALGEAKYQLLEQGSDDQWKPVTDKEKGAEEDGLYTSDKLDGSVNAFELSPGNYKFVEKTAPKGYLLNTMEIPFTIEKQADGEPQVLDIPISGDANVNYQGIAQLYKEAESTSDDEVNKLEGASFDVYTDTDAAEKVTKEPIISNEDGHVTAKGLAPGDYYFQEVSNDKNTYVVNTQKIKFTIPTSAAGKPVMVTTNDQTPSSEKLTLRNYLGAVELTKVDVNDQPLPDAEFTLYNRRNNKEVSQSTSDVNGKVTFNKLSPGDYTIKETKAPKGYLINNQPIDVTISGSADGQPQKVIVAEPFKNYKGSVKLIKTDANNQPLENAEFNLISSSDPSDERRAKSNEAGEVIFNDLAPGDYTFQEVKTPIGYILNTAAVSVKVPDNAEGQPEMVAVKDSFINYQGTVQLTKTDGQNQPLSGATFKVVDANGKDVAGKTAVSDENGLASVDGLAPGNYRFVEIAAPKNGTYIMSNEKLAFKVPTENEGKPEVIKLESNVKNYRGMIRIHKVGNDLTDEQQSVDLAGAEFSLYTKSDFSDARPEKVVSDEKGNVEFKNLAPGTYYVKETAAPNGYLLNSFPLTFVIPDRLPTTEEELTERPITDEQNHTVSFENSTYVVDAGDFQNARKKINLKKSDGEKKGDLDLSKVVFALSYDDGSASGKLVNDHLSPQRDGTIDLSNLALADGSYKLIETQTASNYLISSQPIYFVVKDTQAYGISMTLANYQTGIKGKKVNEENKALAGAEYQIFRSDALTTPIETIDQKGNSQTTIKTTSAGEFYGKGLSAGQYILKEVKAPNGYILDTTAHKFTIQPESGKPAILDLGTFKNYQGKVELTKVDANNGSKQLANAEFQLLDTDQNVVRENLKTNKTGKLHVANLAPGNYYFKETKAPTGYQLSEQLIRFTIDSTHSGKPEQVKVMAKNKLNPQQPNTPKQGFYPKTGEDKGIVLLVVGAIIILIVMGIAYVRKKK